MPFLYIYFEKVSAANHPQLRDDLNEIFNWIFKGFYTKISQVGEILKENIKRKLFNNFKRICFNGLKYGKTTSTWGLFDVLAMWSVLFNTAMHVKRITNYDVKGYEYIHYVYAWNMVKWWEKVHSR